MCVYDRGASEIQPFTKNEAFSEKSKQVFTVFRKKSQSQTFDLVL